MLLSKFSQINEALEDNMAAKSKLTPEEWKHAKDVWEKDPRTGYAWLVREMDLPVSRPAIHKVADIEGWKKLETRKLKKSSNQKPKRKVNIRSSGKNSKVTKITPAKVTVTMADKANDEDGKASCGRPALYQEEYAEQAFKLCLLGAVDKDLAGFFEVTEQTINNWKKDYPEFFESLRRGKLSADANMAYRFYVKGCGYRYTEIKKKVAISEAGTEIPVEIISTEKEVAPDATVAFRWLCNRRPEDWKDKVESSADVKLDKETLQQIKETFLVRMEKARARQDKILIERGILIKQETVD